MKKTTVFLLILTLAWGTMHTLNAQDYIYLRDNSARIAAKNIKTDGVETRYQLYDGVSNAVFALDNLDISLIAYENGSIKYFKDEDQLKSVYEYKKSLFTFHLFSLIVNEFTLSYEHIFSGGKIGLQIPLSLGFSNSNNNGFDNVNNKYFTGLNLNFYPTGQGRVRYYLGPGVQVGQSYYNDDVYANGVYVTDKVETLAVRFYVNNGLVISPVPDMSLSVVGSIGVRYLDNPGDARDEIKTVGAFAFNLSYRF